jgi:hypothetical protein
LFLFFQTNSIEFVLMGVRLCFGFAFAFFFFVFSPSFSAHILMYSFFPSCCPDSAEDPALLPKCLEALADLWADQAEADRDRDRLEDALAYYQRAARLLDNQRGAWRITFRNYFPVFCFFHLYIPREREFPNISPHTHNFRQLFPIPRHRSSPPCRGTASAQGCQHPDAHWR